jgi:hypothetical protein
MTLSHPWRTPFCTRAREKKWEHGGKQEAGEAGDGSALPGRAHTCETERERERERRNREREAELTRHRVPLLVVLCSSTCGPLLLGAARDPLRCCLLRR